jgi:hypothetical protein
MRDEEDSLEVSLRVLTEDADYSERKLLVDVKVNIHHLRRVVGQCRNLKQEVQSLRKELAERKERKQPLPLRSLQRLYV